MCQFSIDVFGPGLQIASTDPNKTWPIFTEVFWKKKKFLYLLLILQFTYCGGINSLWVRLECRNKDDAFKYAQYLVSGISGLKMHKLFNVESKCACVNNFWRIKSHKCVTKITFLGKSSICSITAVMQNYCMSAWRFLALLLVATFWAPKKA